MRTMFRPQRPAFAWRSSAAGRSGTRPSPWHTLPSGPGYRRKSVPSGGDVDDGDNVDYDGDDDDFVVVAIVAAVVDDGFSPRKRPRTTTGNGPTDLHRQISSVLRWSSYLSAKI